MRRPLKPFVTEYKSPNRRQAGATDQPAHEIERPPAKLFDTRTRPEPEDSYEAAMRAADALFSSPAKPTTTHAVEPATPPAMAWNEAQPDVSPAKVGATGGRILRVLDETPPPEYAALEAAHAPKRRGRKPGSKNKPKVLAAAPLAAEAADEIEAEMDVAHAIVPATRVRAPRAARAPRVDDVAPEPTDYATGFAAPPAVHRVEALTASVAAPRGDRKFPWVRDRLKPGEDWKRRRLPRVCW